MSKLLGTATSNIDSSLLQHGFYPLRLAAYRFLLDHPAATLLIGEEEILVGIHDSHADVRVVAGQVAIGLADAGGPLATAQKDLAARAIIGDGAPHMKPVCQMWDTLLLDETAITYVAQYAAQMEDLKVRDRLASNLAEMLGKSYGWPDIEHVAAITHFLRIMGPAARAGGNFLLRSLSRFVHEDYKLLICGAILATGYEAENATHYLAQQLKSKHGFDALMAAQLLNFFGRGDLSAESEYAERTLREGSESGPDYLRLLDEIAKAYPLNGNLMHANA